MDYTSNEVSSFIAMCYLQLDVTLKEVILGKLKRSIREFLIGGEVFVIRKTFNSLEFYNQIAFEGIASYFKFRSIKYQINNPLDILFRLDVLVEFLRLQGIALLGIVCIL